MKFTAIFWLLAVLSLATTGCVEGVDEVETFAGAHTRVVWVQDMSEAGSDVFAVGKNLRLMGWDSHDGAGERAIVDGPTSLTRPLISPDGKRVVFSDTHSGKIFVVDFAGKNKKDLGKGFAVELWQDPNDQSMWIFGFDAVPLKNTNFPLWKMPISGGKKQVVWSARPMSGDNVQLSRDGRVFGALFPWPKGGVGKLGSDQWKSLGRGCWTGLAPDNSQLFVLFDGAHRSFTMFDREGTSWKIPIASDPAFRGFEAYHPRWSNHVRYFGLTGPYLGKGGKPGGNQIGAGGKSVEIFLARFAKDFKSVEAWHQVTKNDRGDFYPDVWIKGGEHANAGMEQGADFANSAVDRAVLDPLFGEAWPYQRDGLLWAWEGMRSTLVLGDGDSRREPGVMLRGESFPGPMDGVTLRKGVARTSGLSGTDVVDAVRTVQAFTLELVLIPASLEQKGPARILSFSRSPTESNFMLGQADDKLVFRVRSTKTQPNGADAQVELAELERDKPVHLLISATPEEILAWVNGKKVKLNGPGGAFTNWDAQYDLLIGNEQGGGRAWSGSVTALMLKAGSLAEQGRRKHLAAGKARIAGWKPAKPTMIKGTVLKHSPIPTVEALGDYRRSLVAHKVRIDEVISGKLAEKEIIVLDWGILDRKPLKLRGSTSAPQAMRLAPLEAHSELEGERIIDAIGDVLLPQFYRVD